jgi:hypothetical protein
MKKSSIVSVGEIIRQLPARAYVVRQLKKVDCKMIGMGAKSSTIETEGIWILQL